MAKRFWLFPVVLVGLALLTESLPAQVRWTVGGRLGLSLYSVSTTTPTFTAGPFGFPIASGTETTTSTAAGLQIGPMGEARFADKFAVGSAFNINTQGGTPIEWMNYFKVFFDLSGSKIKPYADAGFSLFFVTGGPYFCVFGGGGANFPIAPKLYIPADIKVGPVFLTGATGLYLAVTSGIRYEI